MIAFVQWTTSGTTVYGTYKCCDTTASSVVTPVDDATGETVFIQCGPEVASSEKQPEVIYITAADVFGEKASKEDEKPAEEQPRTWFLLLLYTFRPLPQFRTPDLLARPPPVAACRFYGGTGMFQFIEKLAASVARSITFKVNEPGAAAKAEKALQAKGHSNAQPPWRYGQKTVRSPRAGVEHGEETGNDRPG